MKLHDLLNKASLLSGNTVAVAAAGDPGLMEAIRRAMEASLADFILFGDREKIYSCMKEAGIPRDQAAVIPAKTPARAAELAVRAVHQNEADVLMKGNVQTSTLLKYMLNKEIGLRTGQLISHISAFEIPGFDRLIFLTDAAMNVAPDLIQKQQIIMNAVEAAKLLGVEHPLVAPLAAVETVNPAMQATLDAAALTLMNRRGQIPGCTIDGPLALDNAISKEAAEHKGISSPVAGQADILAVHSIEAGNALYKSLVYFAKGKVGAMIAGARAPVVLTSRSDSAESKLYSLAMALCTVDKKTLK